MMKHLFIHIVRAILLLILLFLITTIWLIASETGLQFLIHQAQQWTPGQLRISTVSGRLLTGFRFTDIEYQHQATQLRLQELDFTWQWEDLFNRTLHIKKYHLNGLQLQLPQEKSATHQEKQPIVLPDIQLPLQVIIADLQINQTQFTQIALDTQEIFQNVVINQIILQATANKVVTIKKLAIDIPKLQANLTGSIALQKTYPIELKVNWTGNLPQLGNSVGQGKIKGNIQQLQLTHHLSKPFPITLETTAYDLLQTLRWQAQLQWQQLSFPINDKQKIDSKQGSLNVSGDLQQIKIEQAALDIFNGHISLDGNVAWQPSLNGQIHLQTKKIDLRPFLKELADKVTLTSELEIEFIENTIKIKQGKFKLPETSATVTLVGKADLTPTIPQFQAELEWQNLQFPLVTKKPMISTRQGSLAIEGTIENYALTLNTEVVGQDIPKSQWKIVGQGTQQQFQLEKLQSNILQGKIALTGQVAWQPKITWQLALTGDQINPGAQWKAVPGKLAIEATTSGELLKNGKIAADIAIKQIKGSLRNYPFKLQTIANIKEEKYQIKQFTLISGKNQIEVNGNVDSKLALDWKINAPQLTSLLPNLQGSLIGQGEVRGALLSPRIFVKLTGKKLVFQDNHLADLKADINIDLQKDKDLAINMTATDFKQGKTQVDQLTVHSQGKIKAHTIDTTVVLPQAHVSLQLQGGLDVAKQQWQGFLQNFSIKSNEYGNLQLKNPSSLLLATDQVKLGQSCFQSPPNIEFCSQADWQARGNTAVNAHLKTIPLAIANQFMSPDLALTGELSGNLAVNLTQNGRIGAHVDVNVTPGIITTHIADEVNEHQHQGGKLQVDVSDSGLLADLRLSALKNSGLQGHLTMPNLNHLPITGQQPLQGELSLTFNDLDILPSIVPQAENTQGIVTLMAQVAGDLKQPQVQGKLTINKLSAYLPDLGLELKDLELLLKNDGVDGAVLQAKGLVGAGQLQIDGQAQGLNSTQWNADIQIKGDKLTVVDIPTVWALASPDLQIHIVPNAIDVKGKLLIPEANITPPNITSTVKESEDIVLINTKNPQPVIKSTPAWAISSAVQLILGEKVSLEVAEFKSRLAGSVFASSKPGKSTMGNGELLIVDGIYKAYGQDLRIERGRIIFAGGPIENPALDIKATRTVDDIVAGVHIQGTATTPQLVLFSQPAMDQTNILSYIVLGRPAAEATQGDGNALANAAAALPLKEGDKIAKDLGEDFNLDEVSLGSEGSVEETALTVGKYLSPELYISYGIGLFDASNILKIRYQLNKNWFIESETGKQSGVDLRYILER